MSEIIKRERIIPVTVLGHRAHWLCLLAAVAFFIKTGNAQSHSPLSAVTRQSNEQTVTSLLWKTILTACPVKGASPPEYSYFYAGLPRQGRMLYEYREPADAKEMIRPDNISTADRLNGIEWHGSVIWSAGAYRTWQDGSSGWSEWKGMQKEDLDAKEALASLGSGTLAGNLIFFLEKKRGQWSIAIASIGLLGSSKESFDPEEYWSAKTSCAAATSADPFADRAARPGQAPVAPPTGPAGDQNYAKLVDDLIAENAKSWMLNRFVSGSVKAATIASTDSSGRPSKIVARYQFDGLGGRSPGSVTLTFAQGVPECMYFFDFPATCRTPSPRIVSAYSQGEYKNK